MLAQPSLEAGDQGLLGRCRRHDGGPGHAELDEVSAKEPGTVSGVVVATTSPGARAATGVQ
jgi:hypothetical protein